MYCIYLSSLAYKIMKNQKCRICDCTEDQACPGGCSWVEEDLCDNCVEAAALENEMKTDDYGEIINHPNTYRCIALTLKEKGSIIIGWGCPQAKTHFDLLFSVDVKGHGMLQGGLRPRTDIFVSIMRRGSFGFELSRTETDGGYYEEKLGGGLGTELREALADLINNVKIEYNKFNS